MENKVKLLVIGLGVVAAISLLIAFQLNLTNNKIKLRNDVITQELEKVTQENTQLAQKIVEASNKNKEIITNFKTLESDAKSLREELKALQERLDMTAGERDSLIDKVQQLMDEKRALTDDLTKEKEKRKQVEDKAKEAGQGAQAAGQVPAAGAGQQSYWAEVLRQKADAELELEHIKSQLTEISYKASEYLKERDALQMELKALTQEKEDIERRAAYNERLAMALSEDLVREKDDKEAVIEQLQAVRDDSRMLRSRVKDLDDTKTTLYKKIDSLEEQRNALKQKLEETERMLSDRLNEVVNIKTDIEKAQSKINATAEAASRTVELSPIVVVGEQEKKPSLTGRVISVNKENKFVVIDLGQQQGVESGDTFGVYRNDEYVATIAILQLRKDISAADIKEVSSGKRIEVGDIVKENN